MGNIPGVQFKLFTDPKHGCVDGFGWLRRRVLRSGTLSLLFCSTVTHHRAPSATTSHARNTVTGGMFFGVSLGQGFLYIPSMASFFKAKKISHFIRDLFPLLDSKLLCVDIILWILQAEAILLQAEAPPQLLTFALENPAPYMTEAIKMRSPKACACVLAVEAQDKQE